MPTISAYVKPAPKEDDVKMYIHPSYLEFWDKISKMPKHARTFWNREYLKLINKTEAYMTRRSVYSKHKWALLSKRFLKDNPYCVYCKRQGKDTPATESGHIIPIGICADPFDISNLEPTCKPCNVKKSKTKHYAIHPKEATHVLGEKTS